MFGRSLRGIITAGLFVVLLMSVGCPPLQEGDFVGSWTITDTQRTYNEYHAFMDLMADGTFWVEEYFSGQLIVTGGGYWSYDDGVFWFACSETVAEFSGEVDWGSDHFRVTGNWASGAPGVIDFDRRDKSIPLTDEPSGADVPEDANLLGIGIQ